MSYWCLNKHHVLAVWKKQTLDEHDNDRQTCSEAITLYFYFCSKMLK